MNMFAWIRKKVRDLSRPRDEFPAEAASLNAVQYFAHSNVTTITSKKLEGHGTEAIATPSINQYYKEDGFTTDDNSTSTTIDDDSKDSYISEEESVEIIPLTNGDVEADKSAFACQGSKSGAGQNFSNSAHYRSVKSSGKITRTSKGTPRTSAKKIQDTLEEAAHKLAAYDSQQHLEFIACVNCSKLVEDEICISLDTCEHKVCPRCLRALVHDIIVDNAIEKMKCPVVDCNMKIPRKYFMLFLEGEWRED